MVEDLIVAINTFILLIYEPWLLDTVVG